MAARLVSRRAFSTSVRRLAAEAESKSQLQSETKRNPELYILGGVMVAALAGAGFYFGRTPTKSTSETAVGIAKGGMPWETDTEGKYKYHPGGNPANPAKDAPSALNVVIVPNVTLTKEAHEKYNKWGKDGYP